MAFKKQKLNDKNLPNLRPFDKAESDLDDVKVNPKIFGRVHKLKNLKKKREESFIERTIRIGDKRSAASLSLLFPGLGQIYMGQISVGLAFIFSNVSLFAIYLFLSGILRISDLSQNLMPSYNFHILLVVPFAISILSGISIHMAFGLFPELKLAQLISANKKNRLFWLAFLFPGYGQLLNGQLKKGVIFCSLWILGIFSAVSLYFTYFINWYEYIEELGTRYVEISLLILSAFLLISAFSYVLSIFDTFVVKRNPYLKRPLAKRIKAQLGFSKSPKDKTVYRRTSLKFVFVSFILFFVFSMQLLKPQNKIFYAKHISEINQELKEKSLRIIPSFIGKIKIPEKIKRIEREFREIMS